MRAKLIYESSIHNILKSKDIEEIIYHLQPLLDEAIEYFEYSNDFPFLTKKQIINLLNSNIRIIAKMVSTSPIYGISLDADELLWILIPSYFPNKISDDEFQNAMYRAAMYSAMELVRKNLSKVNPMSEYGKFVLHIALNNGDLDIARKLMAKPNFKHNTKDEWHDVIPQSFANLDSLKFVLHHPKIKPTKYKLIKYRDSDIKMGDQDILRSGGLEYLNNFIKRM